MAQNLEPIWAYCKWCMERRDHEFVKDRGWFCLFCGEHNDLFYVPTPGRIRKAITDVAEEYLKENPEE